VKRPASLSSGLNAENRAQLHLQVKFCSSTFTNWVCLLTRSCCTRMWLEWNDEIRNTGECIEICSVADTLTEHSSPHCQGLQVKNTVPHVRLLIVLSTVILAMARKVVHSFYALSSFILRTACFRNFIQFKLPVVWTGGALSFGQLVTRPLQLCIRACDKEQREHSKVDFVWIEHSVLYSPVVFSSARRS